MPAGDERNAFTAADANHGLHLGRRSRQHDERRRFAQMRQRVAFVGQQLQRLVEDRGITADAPELGDDALRSWMSANVTLPAGCKVRGWNSGIGRRCMRLRSGLRH